MTLYKRSTKRCESKMTKRPVKLALGLALGLAFALVTPVGAQCVGCTQKKDGSDPKLIPAAAPATAPEPSPPPVAPPVPPPALQSGTQSTTLQTGTDSTTLQTGTDSTTLQVGTQNTTIQTGANSTLIQGNVEREAAPLSILILIDCSQSMKEDLKGFFASDKQDKMDAAKKVLENAIASIPSDVNIGLRVFGQSFQNDPYSDCQQSALLVPIGRGNRRTIIERVRQVRPYGLTPLTYGLMQAGKDLSTQPGQKQIILISDGAETCGGDPCAYIRRLTQMGFNIKVDIVGVGLRHDVDAKEQLNCISQSSGGKFYDANSSAELLESIRNSVKQAVTGRVVTKVKGPVLDQLPADLK
jgi:hypothetical protein